MIKSSELVKRIREDAVHATDNDLKHTAAFIAGLLTDREYEFDELVWYFHDENYSFSKRACNWKPYEDYTQFRYVEKHMSRSDFNVYLFELSLFNNEVINLCTNYDFINTYMDASLDAKCRAIYIVAKFHMEGLL